MLNLMKLLVQQNTKDQPFFQDWPHDQVGVQVEWAQQQAAALIVTMQCHEWLDGHDLVGKVQRALWKKVLVPDRRLRLLIREHKSDVDGWESSCSNLVAQDNG